MNRLERAAFLAHSRSVVFERRLKRAREIVADGLSRCENPYVAFSGGKDSEVMLHLVLEQKPDVSVRILTSGETRILHRNFDGVLDWWRERYLDMDFREVLIDRVFSEEWKDSSWYEQRKASHGDLGRHAHKGGNSHGHFDAVFMGLRADESRDRRMSLRNHGPIYRYAGNRREVDWRICPLAFLKLEDIAAGIVCNDIPLLSTYHSEGIHARTTLRLTEETVQDFNHLRLLKARDLDAYNRIIGRFPELAVFS